MTSDHLNLVGVVSTLVFGFVGTVLAIYFYLKSRRHKRLQITYRTSTLQTKAHPEITILFGSESIVNLSRMYVLFWNSGTEEIRATDVPAGAYPTVRFDGKARILSVALVAASSHSPGLPMKQVNSSDAVLTFDYLNPEDGGVAEILYEQPAGEGRGPTFITELIGAQPTQVDRFDPERSLNFLPLTFLMGMVGVTLAQGGWSLSTALLRKQPISPQAVGGVLVTAVSIALLVFLIWSLRNVRRFRIPLFAKRHFGQ